MRPFGASALVGGGDVVRSGGDPNFASLISRFELPDAKVMSLGECVERFLKNDVRRLALQVEG